MVDQEKILSNLLEFYKKKNKSIFKSKFAYTAMTLVDEGDIEEGIYLKFCKDNEIDIDDYFLDGDTDDPLDDATRIKQFKDYGTSHCSDDKPYIRPIGDNDRGRYNQSSC